MKDSFAYSLLKYTHSQVLDETFNVGILFFFPSLKRFEFLYPEKLERIKNLYPNFSEKLLKLYLKGFKEQAAKLSNELVFEYEFKGLISEYFLPLDATFLHFSEPKQVIYDGNVKKYSQLYYNQYLSNYHIDRPFFQRKDEKFIIKSLQKQLNNHTNPIIKERFKIENDTISMKYTSLKVNGYWLNGSKHYLKALSFDLKKPIEIDYKANVINSKLSLLSKELDKFNYRIDILVTPPQENNLNKDFQKAIKILNYFDKNLIGIYDDIPNYVNFATKSLENSFSH